MSSGTVCLNSSLLEPIKRRRGGRRSGDVPAPSRKMMKPDTPDSPAPTTRHNEADSNGTTNTVDSNPNPDRCTNNRVDTVDTVADGTATAAPGGQPQKRNVSSEVHDTPARVPEERVPGSNHQCGAGDGGGGGSGHDSRARKNSRVDSKTPDTQVNTPAHGPQTNLDKFRDWFMEHIA